MINVNFVTGYAEITTVPLYRWDYGQKLQISGITAAVAFQVHFCTKQDSAATIRIAYKVGDSWVVDIPNALLEKGLDITAYIFETGDGTGQTIKRIIIPVIARLKPEEFISQPDPTEEEIIAELLEYCQMIGEKVDEYRTFSDVRVMTKAEYQALETKEEGVIYVFSDDSTLEEIEEEFENQGTDISTLITEVAELKKKVVETYYNEPEGTEESHTLVTSNVAEIYYAELQVFPKLEGTVKTTKTRILTIKCYLSDTVFENTALFTLIGEAGKMDPLGPICVPYMTTDGEIIPLAIADEDMITPGTTVTVRNKEPISAGYHVISFIY